MQHTLVAIVWNESDGGRRRWEIINSKSTIETTRSSGSRPAVTAPQEPDQQSATVAHESLDHLTLHVGAPACLIFARAPKCKRTPNRIGDAETQIKLLESETRALPL